MKPLFLFDWDNTLADTTPIIHQSLNTALTACGLPLWDLEQVRSGLHRSARDFSHILFGAQKTLGEKVYYETFAQLHLSALQPMDGAVRLLDWLQGEAITCAVISNKRGHYLRQEITHLGWQGYFAAAVGAQDAAADKPDPAPVQLAFAQLQRPWTAPALQHTLFIGDSITDIACAGNCGIKAVQIGNTFDGKNLTNAPPHLLSVANCHELTDILEKQGIDTIIAHVSH